MLAPQRSARPLVRAAGVEPLAGYRLLEPLGSGGFGEVWKCEVPGGLFKAIKFVDGGAHSHGQVGGLASRELEALEKIKAIRHPFLLSIERVEILDGVLVIVMELADMNLQCLLAERQEAGLRGIARDELLGYMEEAAEALDVLNFQHGLQHLDVKPHNLFVVGHHIKVGDFGLVNGVPSPGHEHESGGCGTPLYAAPEVLHSSFSRQSDQYSLAIVYQQLLTGTVPFWSAKAYHLVMQHLSAKPDLSALPDHDQPVVAKALAKDPEQRYPSCLDFVLALNQAKPVESAGVRRSGLVRIVRANKAPGVSPGEATPLPTPPPGSGRLYEQTVVIPPLRLPPGTDDLTSPFPETSPRPPNRESRTLLSPSGPAGGHAPLDASVNRTNSLALPGFRLVACLGRGPLADLWTVRDPAGKERLAQCIVGARASEEVLDRLRALRHPALPEREIFASHAGRTILVSDLGRLTLRDRFEECRTQGLPGIPRAELLGYLRAAAAALDDLRRRHGLPHLGLNPGNLLIQGDSALLGEFGLIPLLWIAGGNPAAQLNARYAAPELIGLGGTGSADQYSLALIFAEMLTGVYPRLKSATGKLPAHRRPGTTDPHSGQHRRPDANSNPERSGVFATVKVDLDLLPANDRALLTRALSDDPDQRFPDCLGLIKALEAATVVLQRDEDIFSSLPLVIPFGSLMGEPPPPGIVLPQSTTLVDELIQSSHGAVQVVRADNARYLVHGDGSWEYRCPIKLFAGLLKLKLEGFRQHWNAQLVREDGPQYHYRLVTGATSGPRTLSRLGASRPAGVDLRMQLIQGLGPGGTTHIREAVVRIRSFGVDNTGVRDLAPRLFQSLRAFLQGVPEQRSEDRYPFSQALRVYPILPELELASELDAVGKSISRGGMKFLVPEQPTTDYFYLHFYESPKLAPYALLARATRIVPACTGQVEIGVTFSVDAPRHS